MRKQCKEYCGVSCVNGNCPIALREEYEERCYPVVEYCGECHYYKGCEDCCIPEIKGISEQECRKENNYD